MRETYLDWNATAPLRPVAIDAIGAALAVAGNPSSVHRWGRRARQIVEQAREAVAGLAEVAPHDIVFTSGGTEANHLALHGTGRQRVVISAVEHASVGDAIPTAETIPVDADGVVNLAALDRRLAADPRPALVSVMLANNETGVVQPAAEIARIARAHGALFHCDAVQAAGKISLAAARDADLVSLSAHKLGGPAGTGALVVRRGLDLVAMVRGGGQERSRRAGTENIAGIAGFGAAAAEAAGLAGWDAVRALRDRLEASLRAAAPDAVIFAAGVLRLPNTTAVAMPGVPAETQVIALDLDGVMVSAGAACSSGKVRPSHVLAAMGAGALAGAAIRVSLGWTTTAADIDHFVQAWTALYRRCGGRAAKAAA